MSNSHQTQRIVKHSVHKLLFGHIQIVEIQCSYIIIKT